MLRIAFIAFIALFALASLAGCADDDPAMDADATDATAPGADTSGPDDPTDAPGNDPADPDPGGTSGAEGSYAPCDESRTEVAVGEVPEALGFSAAELLERVGGTREITALWHALDAGPALPVGEAALTLGVESEATTAESFRCDDPDYPEDLRPAPRLEVAVTLTLKTVDGLLDERVETRLAAERVDRARLADHSLELAPADLAGSLGTLSDDYYAEEGSVRLELILREDGSSGVVMGPFSPHERFPCRYTAYASWPADATCWYDQEAFEPGADALEGTLSKLERELRIVFDDGTEASAQLEVALTGDEACRYPDSDDPSVATRIEARLRSADAEMDVVAPGWLSTSTDGDGVEHVDLSASAALDAAALASQLDYEGDAETAIVTFWVALNPNRIPAVELEGGFRLREIVRNGFDTPLPEVELPGGDSERCFDASSIRRTPLMRGEIAPHE